MKTGYFQNYKTPLGNLIGCATDQGVCFLDFSDQEEVKIYKDHFVLGTHPHLEQLKIELKEYFESKRTNFSVKLDLEGTPFQIKVWNELLHIPYGKTISYEKLSEVIGDVKAIRAVGTANGKNPIPILVPCHRVINKSGKLGGYGGGLWRKELLLDLESGQKNIFSS